MKRKIQFWSLDKENKLTRRNKNLRVVWDVYRIEDGLGTQILRPNQIALWTAKIYKAMQLDGLIPVDREAFFAAYLDTKNRTLGVSLISIGTRDTSLVDPVDILRPAIVLGAKGIILAHHHPSGDPSPSNEDIAVTERMIDAAKILGISILDHIVVGFQSFRSVSHGTTGRIENPTFYPFPEPGKGVSVVRDGPKSFLGGTLFYYPGDRKFRWIDGKEEPRVRGWDLNHYYNFRVHNFSDRSMVEVPFNLAMEENDLAWVRKGRSPVTKKQVRTLEGNKAYLVPLDEWDAKSSWEGPIAAVWKKEDEEAILKKAEDLKKKENPELMILGNPVPTEELAEEQFRRFHGTRPKKREVEVEGEEFLIEIGTLKEVVYHPSHGIRSDAEWFHKFRGSTLAASVDGQRLYIVPKRGGKPLRFDPDRGIIGG